MRSSDSRARERARGTHPDAQARECPGAYAHGDHVEVGERQPRPLEAVGDRGHEFAGVRRGGGEGLGGRLVLKGLAVRAQHAGGAGGAGGIEAQDVHATTTRRRSPPACSRRTLAATLPKAGSPTSGHSTKPTRSGVR